MSDPTNPGAPAPAITESSAAALQRASGRRFILTGVALPILGVLAYVLQVQAKSLTAPWYMPCMATLGAVLIVQSLRQQRTVWRFLALGVVAVLAVAEWTFMFGLQLPAYTGPVAAGDPFPEFTTLRADGAAFTRRDLEGKQLNVLVFFRGRW
jgi:hypothetical protein